MKFCVLPHDTWYEGNEGHLALKAHLSADENANLTYTHLHIGNSETPIEDMALVNIIASLVKSSNHIANIIGRPFPLELDPWRIFKSNDRSADALKTQLETNALVKVVPFGEVQGALLKIRLFDQPKPWTTTCAVTRRLVNLVEWSATLQKRFTSLTKFKWDTFDMISARRKYVEAPE